MQSRQIEFNCEFCNKISYKKESAYKRYKRNFCNRKCYSNFRKYLLPKEEQHAYKNGGIPLKEKKKRIKARSDLNHAIRDKKLTRLPCIVCGNKKSEGHHHDYDKPLEVEWLCFVCHRQSHKLIHEHPHLLEKI